MHISSLFGNYSIGSFGKEAKYFVDFLKECGFTYWQVLPFCPTDECNSPYKSHSSFAGNPYFIDLEELREKDLITNQELASQNQANPYVCEFDRLYEKRLNLLKKASQRFSDKQKISEFIDKNPHIESFCKFIKFFSYILAGNFFHKNLSLGIIIIT